MPSGSATAMMRFAEVATGVLATYLEECLRELDMDDPEYEEKRNLIRANQVFPGVQIPRGGNELKFPSIVYGGVGEGTVDTYQSNFIATISIRYDIRAKTMREVYELDSRLREALQATHRVSIDAGAIDLYDDEFSVHRRARTVTMRI